MKRLTWVPVIAGALLLTIAIPTLGASVLSLGQAPEPVGAFDALVEQTESLYGATAVSVDSAGSGDDYYGHSCDAGPVGPASSAF